MLTFCGKVIKPGRGSIVPFSSFELFVINTKPLASPSVPGQGRVVELAALNQYAVHAFATKSNPVLAMGVAGAAGAIGVGVYVGGRVAVAVEVGMGVLVAVTVGVKVAVGVTSGVDVTCA